jgi:hypothetical protein
MCTWHLEISEGPPAPVGAKKNEMRRAVSQRHLGCFEWMKIGVYMPVFDSPTPFQVLLPGWRVLRAYLKQ